MDHLASKVVGDGVVDACSSRYRQLLGALIPQLGERQAVEVVLSAASAALVDLWQGCCQADAAVVKRAMIAEIEKHYVSRGSVDSKSPLAGSAPQRTVSEERTATCS